MRNNKVWLLRVVKGNVKLAEYSSSSPSYVLDEEKIKNKKTKKTAVIAVVSALVLALTLNFVFAVAIGEDLHLNIQTTNATGSIVTGTYAFVFNISTASDCSAVIYTNSKSLTTDSRGIISYYLEDVSLDYDQQYWLCYYRDGTLQNASKIARTPYTFRARNITLSGVEVDSNLDATGYNITADTGFFNLAWSYLTNIPDILYGIWSSNNAGGLLISNGTAIGYNETVLNRTIDARENDTLAELSCSNEQVAKWNTSSGVWYCSDVSAAGAGDIDAVNTAGSYLTGGQTSGTVNLLLNETVLNQTINALENDTTYTAGTGLILSATQFSFNTTYGDDRYYTQTLANTTFIKQSDEGNLNVNASGWWLTSEGALNNVADILGSWINNNLNWINATYGNATYILQSNEGNLNVSESGLLDGYDSGFFMPLNQSVYGTFDFNGGWTGGGLSIDGGDLYAQTIYVYNLTSLNVTQQDLTIVDDFVVFGNTELKQNLTVDTDTLFVDSNLNRVGIGTTSPGVKLGVNGTDNSNPIFRVTQGGSSAIVAFNSSGPYDAIKAVKTSSGAEWQFYRTTDGTLFGSIGFRDGIASLQVNDAELYLNSGLAVGNYQDAKFSGPLVSFANRDLELNPQSGYDFTVNTNQLVVNTTSGNVGINTTTPQNTLNVVGDANITGAFYVLNSKCASGDVLTADTTTGLISCVTDQTGGGGLAADGTYLYNDSTTIYFNTTLAGTDLSVNSSDFWDNLNTPADILGSLINNDLNWINGTYGNVTYILQSNEGNLNVNSSGWWDNLNTPADINAADITDDGTYLLATGDIATGNYTFDSGTFFIDSNNDRVGIGITSPAYPLDVNGASLFRDIIYVWDGKSIGSYAGNGARIYFNTSSGTQFWNTNGEVMRITDDNPGRVGIGTTSPGQILSLNVAGSDAALEFKNSDTVKWTIRNDATGSGSNDAFSIRGDGGSSDTFMTILQDGNVGIGTDSPVSLLNIEGSSDIVQFRLEGAPTQTVSIFLIENGTGTDQIRMGADGSAVFNDEGNAVDFRIEGDTDANLFVVDGSADRVGIGTTSPEELLHLNSAGNTTLFINAAVNNDSTIKLLEEGTGDVGTYLRYDGNNNRFGIWTGNNPPSERFTILRDNGNVGIGTTSPDTLLSVFQTSGSAADFIHLRDTTDTNDLVIRYDGSSNWQFRTETSGTGNNPLTLTNAGKVGINTTTPQNTLNVVGDLNVTGTIFGLGGANITGDYVPYTGADKNVDLGANNFSVDNSVLFVDSNTNRVGIGTSNPLAKLDVALGSSWPDSSVRFVGAGDSLIRVQRSGGAFIDINARSSSVGLDINDIEFLTATTSGNVGIRTTPSSSLFETGISAQTNEVNLSNTLFVNSTSGRVGIGTSSPETNLDVNIGSDGVHGIVLNSDDANNQSARLLFSNTNDQTNAFSIFKRQVSGVSTLAFAYNANVGSTSGTTAMTIEDGGNVGIGTAGPVANLDIESTSNTQLRVSSTAANSDAFIQFRNDVQIWQFMVDGSDSDKFKLRDGAGNVALTVVDNGATSNVGIGTTSPGYLLEVNSSTLGITKLGLSAAEDAIAIGVDGEQDVSIKFFDDDAESTQHFKLTFSASTEDMRFRSDTVDNILYMDNAGNVGIGTASPQNLLNVAGNGNFTGDLTVGGNDIFFETTGSSGMRMGADTSNDYFQLLDGGSAEGILVENIGVDTTYADAINNLSTLGGSSLWVKDNIGVGGNIDFDGELLPDGSTCSNGQILKRTGANNWDCAADDNSGGTMSSFLLAGTSGSSQTITQGNTLLIEAGAGITTTGAATDKVTVAATLGTDIAIGEITFDHGDLGGLGDDDHTQYLALAQDETMTGKFSNTDLPTAATAAGSPVYINPASATANYGLFGGAVGGVEKFRFDEDGDLIMVGSLDVTGSIDIDGGSITDGGASWLSTSGCSQDSYVSGVASDGTITCSADSAHDGTGTDDQTFAEIGAGTATVAFLMGTGGSLGTSGSGTITATDLVCTDCVGNIDLAANSVDLTSDALSTAYAGVGIGGGGTAALSFAAADVDGTCLTGSGTTLSITADCIDDAQVADNSLDATSLAANSVSDSELVDNIYVNSVKFFTGDDYILRFWNDADTGIRQDDTNNQMDWYLNGVEKGSFDLDNGNMQMDGDLTVSGGDITGANNIVIRPGSTNDRVIFEDTTSGLTANDGQQLDIVFDTTYVQLVATDKEGDAELLQIPNGLYVSGSTAYFTNQLQARGGIQDDGGDLILNDKVNITGDLDVAGGDIFDDGVSWLSRSGCSQDSYVSAVSSDGTITCSADSAHDGTGTDDQTFAEIGAGTATVAFLMGTGGSLGTTGTGTITATDLVCTDCVGNIDLAANSVDLTSDALSTAYAGTGILGGGASALGFDCSEVEGTGIDCVSEAITLDATGDWTGTLDTLDAADFLRSNADDSLTAAIIVPTGSRDEGIIGTYDSAKTQQIWSMGVAYRNAADGTSFGNLYGLSYKYNGNAGGHGVYLVQNGADTVGLGTNLWTSGAITGATINTGAGAKEIGDDVGDCTTSQVLKGDGGCETESSLSVSYATTAGSASSATNSNACSGDSVCETVGMTVSTGTISDTDTAYVTFADGIYSSGGSTSYFDGLLNARGGLADDGGYLVLADDTQLGASKKLYFNGGTTYGIGVSNNYNSGFFDTVEAGSGTLELVYYTGNGVDIGSGGSKWLRASTLDTGQGANNLYDMNQNVLTTSNVQFGDGAGGGTDITVGASATGKIDAATFDPLYTINNVTYATYLPGMSGGVKEEVTGTVMLNSDYTIDFNSLGVSSDLWLFYQITDFGEQMENLQIILTPSFNGNVWYEKNPLENTLIIYGNKKGEVSFRMTANRYDWMNWSNYAEGKNRGSILREK